MRIALLGFGGMGKVVAARAKAGGHTVGVTLTEKDSDLGPKTLVERLKGHDAAIDFSVAAAVPAHLAACVGAGVPLVEGTTGWADQETALLASVESGGGAVIHGANFSIGVNLFYRLVSLGGELLGRLPAYAAAIDETHHAKKRDKPSGTALTLARVLEQALHRDVPIASTRTGDAVGVHRVTFDSHADQIALVHTAHSRDGFAAGALLAARWISAPGRRGVYRFADVLDDILAMERTPAA